MKRSSTFPKRASFLWAFILARRKPDTKPTTLDTADHVSTTGVAMPAFSRAVNLPYPLPSDPIRSISVVIPAMDEEQTIGAVLSDLGRTIDCKLRDYGVEVLVVDDHSVDKTAIVAEAHGATVVSNQYRPGKGNALRYGFERTTGDVIVMLDADYSHQAEDLPELLKPLENGAGLVIASRILGGSEEYTIVRAFGNLVLTFVFGMFHGRYLSDALNGYKAFRREIFFDHEYTSSDFEIEIELLANAIRSGYKIVEVPSYERMRCGGVPKSKAITHGFKFLFRVIRESMKDYLHKRQALVGSRVSNPAAIVEPAQAVHFDPENTKSIST